MTTTKTITPIGTLSYPQLHEAKAPSNGKGDPKFSAAIVFPAGTDLSALKAAAIEAAREKFGAGIKAGGKVIPIEQAFDLNLLKSPFRTDALAKGYPEGSTFINVRTARQPGLVFAYAGPDGKPAPVPHAAIKDEFYPGAKVRASINAFGYDTEGNKGVSFALNNAQKVGEGDRLDNRVSAADEFDVDLNAQPASLESIGL